MYLDCSLLGKVVVSAISWKCEKQKQKQKQGKQNLALPSPPVPHFAGVVWKSPRNAGSKMAINSKACAFMGRVLSFLTDLKRKELDPC